MSARPKPLQFRRKKLILHETFAQQVSLAEVLNVINVHRHGGTLHVYFGDGAVYCGAEWEEPCRDRQQGD